METTEIKEVKQTLNVEAFVGKYVSLVQYFKVLAIDFNGGIYGTGAEVTLETPDGTEMVANAQLLHEQCKNGEFYETIKEVTRTELINILETVDSNVFTAEFTKLNGDKRIVTGYLVKRETGFGRSLVFDLNKREIINVDHRTLTSIIFKNVKYVQK